MANNDLTSVMIDPSLIVAKSSLNKVFKYIGSPFLPDFKVYISKSFYDFLYTGEADKVHPGFMFFLGNAYPADLGELRYLLNVYSDRVVPFEIESSTRERYHFFRTALLEELRFRQDIFDQSTLDTLFEEWVFLQEHSLVVSRVKKSFSRMTDAGCLCLHFGRWFGEALVRRTLKKQDDELVHAVDTLRAIAKWIAVGGPQIAALYLQQPLLASALFPAGVFLLLDPDHSLMK